MFATIRSRLVALVIAVALPAFAVLVWVFSEQVRREHNDALDLALRIARSIANDLQTSDRRSNELLARMARRPKISEGNLGDCDSLFAIVDLFPRYLDLVLYDVNGVRLCSSTPRPSDAQLAAMVETLIPRHLATARNGAIDPLIAQKGGLWISAVFRPVMVRGELKGYLVLVQSLDLSLDAYPSATVVTFADRGGRVIARSKEPEKWIGQRVPDTPLRRRALQVGEGRAEANGIDGVRRQYGYIVMPGSGWTISVGLPSGVAMASVRELEIRGALAGVVIIAAVVLLAFRISRTIGYPIQELTRAVRRVAGEGYSGKVPASGPREIEVLGEAFNQMVGTRSEAERLLIESREQLEALSDKLLHIQEDERTRIAREIHDELGQLLTALKMDVEGLVDTAGSVSTAQTSRVRRIRTVMAQMVDSVQRIAAELRPPLLDDFGLAAAIESEVQAFEERTGIECELSMEAPDLAISRETDVATYRIIQEALTNVARHSDASRVEIRAREREGFLLIELRDDGRGIAREALADRRSLGLVGMRERARTIGASLEIEGIAGRGTIVSLRIPLPPVASRSAL